MTLAPQPSQLIPQLKYKQVEIELRQLAETLPVGAKLPSERNLAISYNCNFLTVRKALKQLVEDGTVTRRVGSGTFVTNHKGGAAISVRQRNPQVGILLFHPGNSYSYRVLQSIAHAGLEESIELRSSWIQDFGEDALSQATALKNEGCIALTLPWFPHEKIDEASTFVQQCALPVSLALPIPGLERNCFEKEIIFGARAMKSVEALIRYYQALGHKRIAFIGPDSPTDVILQKMLSAYACHVSRENLPHLCGLLAPAAASANQLAERWQDYRGDLAIISYDDEHALRLMTAMHKIGLSAPDDYAIVGFNDTEASRFSDPPLSTIRQNFDYIGHWLLRTALSLAQGAGVQSSVIPRPQLLVQGTCGGAEKIDDAFRELVPSLDMVFGEGRETALPPERAEEKALAQGA